MIQCRTVSVKGSYDDTEFARLRSVMEELFPQVHRRMEWQVFSDDCWVYELPGKGPSRSVMLMSHHDVAAAAGDWAHDPFGGELTDGKLWSQGTVDTKTPLLAEFSALEGLLDEGGAIIDPPLGGMTCEKCAMVAVHEKGRYKHHCAASAANVHTGLTAAAQAGPIERMAGFLNEAASGKLFVRRLNLQVRAMFAHLAPHCKFPM